MSSKLKFLIHVAIGLVIALLLVWAGGIFSASETSDVLRILCDGFFAAAALLLAYGGLRWTYNGGVMDGLGYSAKTLVNRVRYRYETEHRESFMEYRENREKKASSPKMLLLSGLVHLGIAVILFAVYYIVAG